MSGTKVRVGTSGWSYKSWHKTFYPPRLPAARHFEHYASRFNTVEINATFYRLPSESMVAGWARKAPPGFVYAVKGSRFVTHMKKLANPGDALDRFFDRMEPLRHRIGVILWQLPPMLQLDLPRLAAFFELLPRTYDHAVEFRHPSWIQAATFDLLRKHRVAHVSVSSLAMPMDLTVTAEIVYLRFHGLVGGFAHDYTRAELAPWAEHVRAQAAEGRTVYAYFNNDANVRAPANAQVFIEMTLPKGEVPELEVRSPGNPPL